MNNTPTTMTDLIVQFAQDTTFSTATTPDEWKRENEIQPFAMLAHEEGTWGQANENLPGELHYDPYGDTTTYRIFIKLAGKIFSFDLEGSGDPFTPFCCGVNFDSIQSREPVLETIWHKKCYPLMVEDWLTYYNKVGYKRGEAVNGIEPMVLKSSKSVRGVEADLMRMKSFRNKWWAEYETKWKGKPYTEEQSKWSAEQNAKEKEFVDGLIENVKRMWPPFDAE